MASALSIYGDVLLNCITSTVTLTNPFADNRHLSTKGIWDTGATNSVITRSSAQQLGLVPISRAVVNGVHGSREVNVYYVRIRLNDQIGLETQVTECEELSPDLSIGMLIGMNVIMLGDFSITNFDNRTVMSFVVPSQRKTDFVAEINEYNRFLKIHESRIKVGNNLCPCGSKKQWNNCHGKKTFR